MSLFFSRVDLLMTTQTGHSYNKPAYPEGLVSELKIDGSNCSVD